MNYLEILGTIVGLIYLWLEYKASIHLWIVGIIMPAIYIFVYYRAGLYADFGINIYYLLAAVYGYIEWKYGFGNKKQDEKEDLPITHVPLKVYAPLVIVFALCWGLIAYILIEFTNSNVPVWDSFITALSIVAMWMLARKFVEQWLPWIVVDAVSTGLYIYKGLYFTAGLYGLYAIIAIFGYYSWLMKMKQKQMNQ
jgi:nicotinamide mononucleotide transporter